MVKIDRRIRQYKNYIVKKCKELNIKEPLKVELMNNYRGKKEKTFVKVQFNKTNNDYILKIRKGRQMNGQLILWKEEEIQKNIYDELLHTFEQGEEI